MEVIKIILCFWGLKMLFSSPELHVEDMNKSKNPQVYLLVWIILRIALNSLGVYMVYETLPTVINYFMVR